MAPKRRQHGKAPTPSADASIRRYRIPDGIIDRVIGDEVLIHRFDTDQVFVLNGDAKLVFEAVKQVGVHDAIQVIVGAQVFGDSVDIDAAVDGALTEMLARGLIELESPGGAGSK